MDELDSLSQVTCMVVVLSHCPCETAHNYAAINHSYSMLIVGSFKSIATIYTWVTAEYLNDINSSKPCQIGYHRVVLRHDACMCECCVWAHAPNPPKCFVHGTFFSDHARQDKQTNGHIIFCWLTQWINDLSQGIANSNGPSDTH